MKSHSRRATRVVTAAGLWSVAVMSLLLGSDAAAQTPVRSFAELQPLLKPGQTVIVTTDEGGKTAGQVVSILGNQLEIRKGGTRYVFTEDAVGRIQHEDGVWNGSLIGIGVGVLLARAFVAKCRSTPFPERPSGCETAELSYVWDPLLGWLVGALVDDLIKKSLYVSPRPSPIALTPLVGRGRLGVAVTIQFQPGAR